MAITPNTGFTSGQILTADQMTRLPWGILNYSAAITAVFTTSSTHTTFQDVTNYTASVTYQANRILRVSVQVAPYTSGGANGVSYKIIRGSTDIDIFDVPNDALTSGTAHNMFLSHTFAGPGSSATETFKLQMRALTNNTSVSNFASATNIGRLIVEDLGAA